MISLQSYLDDVLSRPWQWGALDCCFFAGDWIRAATGRDPLGPYRGTYDDARGARRLIARRGGLLAMVSVEMERCGFGRVADPQHGDIGVADMPSCAHADMRAGDASVMIMNGPWWMGCGLDEIVGVDVLPAVAWRVL